MHVLELGAIPVILNPRTSPNTMEEGWHLLLLKAFSCVSTTCISFCESLLGHSGFSLILVENILSLLFTSSIC